MSSVETKRRWVWMLIVAVAPIAWGSTYFVTRTALPADAPLWGAALRALPAGLVLLALARRAPRGSWWWRAVVLGLVNFSAFFVLIYLSAQLLPSSVASAVMATAPFALAIAGFVLLRERVRVPTVVGAFAGALGVILIVGLGSGAIDGWGVAAAFGALVANAVGSVLAKRWRDDTPVLATTAWQLVVGGLALTLVAGLVEGAPPALDARGWLAIAYLSFVATALAFVCWFSALARLPVALVGVIGLLNPVTGVLLGTLAGGETLTLAQVGGILLVLAGILIGAIAARTPRAPASGRASRPAPTGRPRGSDPATRAADRLDRVATRSGADAAPRGCPSR